MGSIDDILNSHIGGSGSITDRLFAALKNPSSGGGGFKGAVICRADADGTQAVTANTRTSIIFPTELIDTDDFFNPASNTIFTIPAGVTRVALNCSLGVLPAATNATMNCCYRNPTANTASFVNRINADVGGLGAVTLPRVILDVSEGDTFDISIYISSFAGTIYDSGESGTLAQHSLTSNTLTTYFMLEDLS